MAQPNVPGSYLAHLRERAGKSKRAASIAAGLKSDTFWGGVERGYLPKRGSKIPALPSPGTLLSMARAVDASPHEIRELFRLFGYLELWEAIATVVSLLNRSEPLRPEDALRHDHTLPREVRDVVLNVLAWGRSAFPMAGTIPVRTVSEPES
jgi:hypothetical protein